MLTGIKIEKLKTILEPSAGKGDIVDYIFEKSKNSYYEKPTIDCIELDKELKATLKGKRLHSYTRRLFDI